MKIYSIKEQSHFFGTIAEQHVKRINPFFLPTESGPNLVYLAKEITKIRYKDKINSIKKRFSI